eukprot:scaffold87108_cov21-Tisochrysis_lutea.AAC.2
MKILVPSVQDCFQAAYPTKHTTYQDAPVPRWTKTQTWTYRLRQEKDNKSHGASKVICACTCSLYLPGPHFSSGSSAMQNMFTPLMGVPSCGVHTSCGAHQAEEAKRKWSGPDEVLCPDAAP